jgi:hypothetical protein
MKVPEIKRIQSFMKNIAPNAEIIIIISVREYVSFVQSSISQNIKKFSTESSAIDWHLNMKGAYKSRIEKFIKIFGKKNVIVYKFEDSVKHRYGPAGYFFELIGLGDIVQEVKYFNANIGIGSNILELMSYINHRIPSSVKGTPSPFRKMDDLKPIRNVKGGSKYQIPNEKLKLVQRKAIREHFWLKINTGIGYRTLKRKKNKATNRSINLEFIEGLLGSFDELSSHIKAVIIEYCLWNYEEKGSMLFFELKEKLLNIFGKDNYKKSIKEIDEFYSGNGINNIFGER